MSTDVRALQELPSLYDDEEQLTSFGTKRPPFTVVCTICSIPSLATENEASEA